MIQKKLDTKRQPFQTCALRMVSARQGMLKLQTLLKGSGRRYSEMGRVEMSKVDLKDPRLESLAQM